MHFTLDVKVEISDLDDTLEQLPFQFVKQV